MAHTIHLGDCRSILREIPAGSVRTCITSPPYFGLRDYGTAAWEGGDAGCDHVEKRATNGHSNSPLLKPTGEAFMNKPGLPYRDVCGKCGARRVDKQIGLEASLDCGRRRLFRLRPDLTAEQREYVVRRLLAEGRPDA